MENKKGMVEPRKLKRLRLALRQLTCRHGNRVREGVYRPQGSAQRRERYSCPECQRVWSVAAPLPARSNSTSPL
jgi:transposase-like protein